MELNTIDSSTPLIERLAEALKSRVALVDVRHEAAFRLFNGFTEGWSDLAIDLYGRTLVIHDYAEDVLDGVRNMAVARGFYEAELPWLGAILWKARSGTTAEERNGKWISEAEPDRRIREHGVWYALDLQANRDAGLYLDTRNLREWLIENMAGARVLNTFAYTGSLGVAAKAGGASRVVHIDLKRAFLNVAKTSYTLNGFPIAKGDFVAGDFWPQISRLIKSAQLFDCVIVDPPFFAQTAKGKVDLEKNYSRVLNKVRPLIADGGRLVAINNGLYVSGAEFMATLNALCSDGYLKIEELIPVGPDFTGTVPGSGAGIVTDPAPFNHSTKIAVIRVRRKDGLKA
ncbi:MAG: class I SAM-dependent methyltransferase [Blastocatellia bacterium]|jgi:23S rRNA (cytosine1962-C5)-methyltransferase